MRERIIGYIKTHPAVAKHPMSDDACIYENCRFISSCKHRIDFFLFFLTVENMMIDYFEVRYEDQTNNKKFLRWRGFAL